MTPNVAQRINDLASRGLLWAVQEAADRFHVQVVDVVGDARPRSVAMARRHAYLTIRELGLSYPEIGALFGRDHSTVIYGVRVAQRERQQTEEEHGREGL